MDFTISYTDHGTLKASTMGFTHIDFVNGEVFDADGTKTTLLRSLKNNKAYPYVRSVAVYCSQGTKIDFGGGTKYFGEAGEWAMFENLMCESMNIETTIIETPNAIDLLVVASTSPTSSKQTIATKKTRDTAAAAVGDNYATVLELYGPQFNHHTLSIVESGTTNGLTYKIEGKNTLADTYTEIQGDTAVAASGSDIVQIEGVFPYLKLSIKNTVGASAAESTCAYSAQKR